MIRKCFQWILVCWLLSVTAGYAVAHCEMPCGIYDDQMRLAMIGEHIATIEKSMQVITELTVEKPMDHNQVSRWVMNKENHANELQHIVAQYFMTQRIKPDAKGYTEKLTLLHKMLISAMKCKQTTDPSHVSTLRTLLEEFRGLYLGEQK